MSQQKSTDGFVKPAQKETKQTGRNVWHTLAWFGMLFVIVSIAFSSYMVYFGSDSIVAKAMLAPQVIFAAGVAIYKFAFAK